MALREALGISGGWMEEETDVMGTLGLTAVLWRMVEDKTQWISSSR